MSAEKAVLGWFHPSTFDDYSDAVTSTVHRDRLHYLGELATELIQSTMCTAASAQELEEPYIDTSYVERGWNRVCIPGGSHTSQSALVKARNAIAKVGITAEACDRPTHSGIKQNRDVRILLQASVRHGFRDPFGLLHGIPLMSPELLAPAARRSLAYHNIRARAAFGLLPNVELTIERMLAAAQTAADAQLSIALAPPGAIDQEQTH